MLDRSFSIYHFPTSLSLLKNRLVRSLRNSTVWTKAVPDPPDGGESSRSISGKLSCSTIVSPLVAASIRIYPIPRREIKVNTSLSGLFVDEIESSDGIERVASNRRIKFEKKIVRSKRVILS